MYKKKSDFKDLNGCTRRMTKSIQHIVCFVLLSCSFYCSFSQIVSFKAVIDKNTILIGEPIQLKLEAILPMGTDVKWLTVDSVPHFEFIEQAAVDTVRKIDGKILRQTLTLTSFDSGRWIIPSMALNIQGRYYLTDSFAVSVAFSNFDPSQEYHDIKDILEVANPYTKYINWLLAAVTLLALLAVIYFLRKQPLKLSQPVKIIQSTLSPIEEALQLMEELKKQQLPQHGQVKLYYTRLNDILRSFIWRRLTMATLQKTNDELILQVKQSGLPNDTFISLAQTLRMSDAVKFAKYIPENSDNEKVFSILRLPLNY